MSGNYERSERRRRAKKGKALRKCLFALVAVLVVLAAGVLLVWNINRFALKVTMAGSEEITLEHGQSFTDPGASASFSGTILRRKPETVSVTTTGTVDTEKLGTYVLAYTAEYQMDSIFGHRTYTETRDRVVHIVDTKAPEITLVADPEVYTLPGEIYAEEGYKAVDDYDGDITSQVVRQVVGETVVYTVSDSSGNQTQVIRQVVYDDPIPPEIVLEGKPIVVVNVGKEYTEPGYKATDNVDGDITDRVVVEGTVDTSKEGVYELTYTVKDSYDNTVSVTRKVEVVVNATSGSGAKAVYLTFDDGPCSYTSQILDILDKYNVKATFFVVGTSYPELLTRMANSGHTVAIHSMSHNYKKIYASEEAFFEDLYAEQNHIAAYTGKAPTLLRFPGGSSNKVSSFNPGIMTRLTQKINAMGYTYFDWNVDSQDAGGAKTSDEVYQNVINGISGRKTSVVLMHDIHTTTLGALERIIQWGLANDCYFYALNASSPTAHHGVNN